jgi:DNA (cytosine-5)-methyltransferase 1
MSRFKVQSKNSFVSLFCGCGGLDLGFHELGFEPLFAADNDPAAIKAYNFNLGPYSYIRDVSDVSFHQELNSIKSPDVVLGGFPCQGFSKAGPKVFEDERNVLYKEMLGAVGHLKSKLFIAENVDGLSQNFGGKYLRTIIKDFTNLGYNVDYRILDAASFGVAQHRRRIIFVGVRIGFPKFVWPSETHVLPTRNGESKLTNSEPTLWEDPDLLKPLLPTKTIANAISDMPDIGEMPDHNITSDWPKNIDDIISSIGLGQKLCNVRQAASSVHTWDIPKVFGTVTPIQKEILECISCNRRHKKYGSIPNGNPLSIPDIESILNKELKTSDFDQLVTLGYLKMVNSKYDLKGAMFCSGLYKRPSLNDPSPTILTCFHNPRYLLHPVFNRPLSLRECARIQGFPDSFLFTDSGISLKDGYRLVGNAVPPPLGQVFAKATNIYLANLPSNIKHAA